MKKVIIASKNPVKVNAVQKAFELVFVGEQFEYEAVSSVSGVSDQPMSDAETFTGAMNRVSSILKANADYFVAIEGGVQKKSGEYEVLAWVVVKDKVGKIGKGRSATFFLPHKIGELLSQGVELSKASDCVFQESESGKKQGTIGILTGNVIDRTKYYVDPVVLALIPFKNPESY